MNIFATSSSPAQCAQALDNRRLVKMTLETAQIICTVLSRGPYKPTHIAHPVVVWVAASPANLCWTRRHFQSLTLEYNLRFKKAHACAGAMFELCAEIPFVEAGPTSWQNSARNNQRGFDFTHLPVFDAYRAYLAARWRREYQESLEEPHQRWNGVRVVRFPRKPAPAWSVRGMPQWFLEAGGFDAKES